MPSPTIVSLARSLSNRFIKQWNHATNKWRYSAKVEASPQGRCFIHNDDENAGARTERKTRLEMSTGQTRLYCRMLLGGSARRSTSFARISFERNARSAANSSADSLLLYSGIPEMHEVPAMVFFRPFLRARCNGGLPYSSGIKKRFLGLPVGPSAISN